MSLSKYEPTTINGWVSFRIPDVSHPALGENGVTVSGKYRRIQPHFSRDEVDPYRIKEIVDRLLIDAELCGFKNDHFQRFDMRTITENSVKFGCYWYPEEALDSGKLYFFIWFCLWTWVYDDGLEEGWNSRTLNKTSLGSMKNVHGTYLKILRKLEIDDPLLEAKEFPDFARLCKWAHKIVEMGEGVAGSKDEYINCIEPLASNLEAAFQSNEWYTVSRINEGPERYSLPTFHVWRVDNGGPECTHEALVFSRGIRISPDIRKHPAFRRLNVILGNSVVGVNDLLGMKKDFGHYLKTVDPDNEIAFRVLNKGHDIQAVVTEMCSKMDEELRDLILIKESLLELFGEDENLLRYFGSVDNFIDGQNQVYVENTRYSCKRGFVSLMRDEQEEAIPETVN